MPTELSYPNDSFAGVYPSPTSFTGQRTLDFVLKNRGYVDKTLLFDLEVIRIDKGRWERWWCWGGWLSLGIGTYYILNNTEY